MVHARQPQRDLKENWAMATGPQRACSPPFAIDGLTVGLSAPNLRCLQLSAVFSAASLIIKYSELRLSHDELQRDSSYMEVHFVER
jgi:hypothetical protein